MLAECLVVAPGYFLRLTLGQRGPRHGRLEGSLPGLIDRDMTIHALADKVEAFDPGQERGRRLIYSYPADAMPTRAKCANVTFPLPRQ